ncbi:MAG: NUDIX domain-containing protein [Candidatus Woesearchaeota archaeon]
MIRGVDYIGVGTGAMIFRDDGMVLLAQRGAKARNEQGKWDFPGGSVRFGEKCSDAIKREIREELDIDIEVLEMLEVVDHIIPEEHQHWVSPSYVAKLVQGRAKIMEPMKCSGIKWVELKQINPGDLSISSRSNLGVYINKYGYNSPEVKK